MCLLFLSMIMFASCSTTKYIEVPVEKIHTEYRTDTVFQYKNLIERDSIYINQYVKGDTVYNVRYKYKYINHTDTLYRDKYIMVTDTIDRPVYIEKEVEVRYVPWYAKILSWIGGLFILAIALRIGYKIYVKRW